MIPLSVCNGLQGFTRTIRPIPLLAQNRAQGPWVLARSAEKPHYGAQPTLVAERCKMGPTGCRIRPTSGIARRFLWGPWPQEVLGSSEVTRPQEVQGSFEVTWPQEVQHAGQTVLALWPRSWVTTARPTRGPWWRQRVHLRVPRRWRVRTRGRAEAGATSTSGSFRRAGTEAAYGWVTPAPYASAGGACGGGSTHGAAGAASSSIHQRRGRKRRRKRRRRTPRRSTSPRRTKRAVAVTPTTGVAGQQAAALLRSGPQGVAGHRAAAMATGSHGRRRDPR